MQSPVLLAALLLTALSMGGVAVNEATHGEVAQMMGFGHRHMFDAGGYHCSPHNHAEHGPDHEAHMHGNHSMPHDQCPGGQTMHEHTHDHEHDDGGGHHHG